MVIVVIIIIIMLVLERFSHLQAFTVYLPIILFPLSPFVW